MTVKLKELVSTPISEFKNQRWDWPMRGRRCLAEAIGVFALVFAAGGTTITGQEYGGQAGLVRAALASGLMVMAMIYSLGHICGAHFNPAVTLAFTFARRFPWREVPGYVVAQLLGASCAAAALRLLFGNVARLGANVPAGSSFQAVILEGIISFFLMFVIIAVATDSRAVGQSAAIAIGVTVAVAILIAGPVSGASMNPARSFGPALLSGTWQDHWVYWLGPIIGATLGAFTYQVVRGEERRSYRHEQ